MINTNLNLEVYFQIKHTIAAILCYISSTFGMISRENCLYKFTPNELSLLLMHRKLNVKSEDEVIDALILWFSKNGNVVDEKETLQILN